MVDAAFVRVRAEVLQDLLVRLLKASGCDDENAAVTATGFLEADLRGHRIQGVDHLFSTIHDLLAGKLNGRARPRITQEFGATALIDGDGATGQSGGIVATREAVIRAQQAGVAVVGLVNAGDIFMLGFYAERIATAGLVAIVMSNSYPTHVHPFGGIDPVVGTNPLAFAFPTNGDPIVVDLATSVSAIGHVRIAGYYDEPIRDGVGIDANGRPTTDAQKIMAGALSPLGGHKGYGLGLAVALMSGPVIGALIGKSLQADVQRAAGPGRRGHIFMAINPAAFGSSKEYFESVDAYVVDIKQSRRAPGVEEIYLPGEQGFRRRRTALTGGIDMLDKVWQHTADIAARLGVTMPELEGEHRA
jgi:LDH2 family malate/lactate/ureidoglycolate dehydrogenase